MVKILNYTIENVMFDGLYINYRCPFCEEPLRSPIMDAGNNDKCPDCGKDFIVPGTVEKSAYLKEQEAKEGLKRLKLEQKYIRLQEKSNERVWHKQERQYNRPLSLSGEQISSIIAAIIMLFFLILFFAISYSADNSPHNYTIDAKQYYEDHKPGGDVDQYIH